MGYTWEEVMLNIDVRDEAKREAEQQREILEKKAEEDTAMGLWSLGLSILGGALFGPAGYAAGKIGGRWIGDISNTWEYDEVDAGKFYKDQAAEFKRTRDKAAKDQTSGQIFNAVTDLATMYIQAGGLQEGPTDLTTFGSGEGEWSVRGKKGGPTFGESFTEAGPDAPGLSMDYTGKELYPVTFESDIPSLFSEWQKDAGILANIKPIGKKIASTNTGMSSLDTLFQSYIAGKEEKEA